MNLFGLGNKFIDRIKCEEVLENHRSAMYEMGKRIEILEKEMRDNIPLYPGLVLKGRYGVSDVSAADKYVIVSITYNGTQVNTSHYSYGSEYIATHSNRELHSKFIVTEEVDWDYVKTGINGQEVLFKEKDKTYKARVIGVDNLKEGESSVKHAWVRKLSCNLLNESIDNPPHDWVEVTDLTIIPPKKEKTVR